MGGGVLILFSIFSAEGYLQVSPVYGGELGEHSVNCLFSLKEVEVVDSTREESVPTELTTRVYGGVKDDCDDVLAALEYEVKCAVGVQVLR